MQESLSSIDSLIEGFTCEGVSVFDVYAGDGLDVGKKSVSLSMQFRAQDRTLKDTEVNLHFLKPYSQRFSKKQNI